MLPTRRGWRGLHKGGPCIARDYVGVASREGALNAIVSKKNVHPNAEQSSKSKALGPLAGRSILVKDNIVTSDLPSSAASRILTAYQSPFDATVVELLEQSGASISAKTNLDEFGMGSHTQSSWHQGTLSPFSRKGVPLSPGGSSGGSAVAVATGQSWAALGTDTGGSVRLPAAYVGLVGMKPSYGLLSRWGVIQYANSLDTVGIMASSARDVRTTFNVLNVYDRKDPTSLSQAFRDRLNSRLKRRSMPLRVGVPLEYNVAEISPAVRSAYVAGLRRLHEAGHTLHPVRLPSTRQALSAYYVLAPAEASSNLAKYDGIRYGLRNEGPDASPEDGLPLYAPLRGESFGEEVKRRILLGAYTLSSEAMDNYFVQAQRVRRLVQRDFDAVFAQANPLLEDQHPRQQGVGAVDVLATPTAPTLPPTVEQVEKLTPVESYMNDVFTVPASLAGLPAISVPVDVPNDAQNRLDMEDGEMRSAGLQIIGQFGDDDLVLDVAEMMQIR